MAQLQNFNIGGNFLNAMRAGQADKRQQQSQDFRHQLLQQQQNFREQQAPIKNELESRKVGVNERKTGIDEGKARMEGLTYLGQVAQNLSKHTPENLQRFYPSIKGQLEQAIGQQLPETITHDDLAQFSALVQQEQQKWSAPKAAMNAQGQEVFIQDDGYGNIKQIDGFAPTKKTPLVQVNTGAQESQFAKEKGKLDAQTVNSARQDYLATSQMTSQLNEAEKMLSEFSTGRMTPFLSSVSSVWGGTLAQQQQAFDANANQLVLKAAESLKGALSDRDIELLKNSTINSASTPEANMRIINLVRKGIEIKRQQFEAMEKHANEKGSLRGFTGYKAVQEPQQQNQPFKSSSGIEFTVE